MHSDILKQDDVVDDHHITPVLHSQDQDQKQSTKVNEVFAKF